jgi:hypothetical protein
MKRMPQLNGSQDFLLSLFLLSLVGKDMALSLSPRLQE